MVKAPDFDSGIRGFESFLPSPTDGVDGTRKPQQRLICSYEGMKIFPFQP